MALDGIVISNITKEIRDSIINGRINKIAQPEKDELLLTIKGGNGQQRLLISASASLPLIYFTRENKLSPMTAPNFCMLLRKHIGSGRIIDVRQPGLERIIEFEIQHLDELGDVCRKYLIVEIMGKHSNIIFCDEQRTIIDSIKHVSAHMSSVREVLPGRPYFVPNTAEKLNPLTVSEADFKKALQAFPGPLGKGLISVLTGISPIVAEEICTLASLESTHPANALNEIELTHLYHIFDGLIDDVRQGTFSPAIYYKGPEPFEFSSVLLSCYSDYHRKDYESISLLLEDYFAEKNKITRIRQKSVDLRRVVQTALERSRKKYDLQLKQLKDTEKRDKYRLYGEFINAYSYMITGGEKELIANDYYNNDKEIKIPLDPTLSANENSQKYFSRYNKLKRTHDALVDLIQETKEEIDHLESISIALEITLEEADLAQIKEELTESGYIKRRYTNGKKARITSKPFHYVSSDGFHMYVGKNNYQNEDLTFKVAQGNDWWFHAKGIPGSHVIVKSEGKELPDKTFEEAAALAAYYSKGRGSDKVEVDYIEKKHIKKPGKGKPGFVIYHTNYSLVAAPGILVNEV